MKGWQLFIFSDLFLVHFMPRGRFQMLHTGPLITQFYLVFFFSFVGSSALLLATTHVGLMTLRQLRNSHVR